MTSWKPMSTAPARSWPSVTRSNPSGAISPIGTVPDDFPLVKELRAEGATDYAAIPLVFSDGTVHVATWSTRAPGGFTSQQLADLDAVIAPLTRVAEILALRRTATNLLNTYVGRQAGERILMGEIRRGFVEEIRAIIWLSDMRGFTALSERLA